MMARTPRVEVVARKRAHVFKNSAGLVTCHHFLKDRLALRLDASVRRDPCCDHSFKERGPQMKGGNTKNPPTHEEVPDVSMPHELPSTNVRGEHARWLAPIHWLRA